jgi:hypothetical protein
VIVYAQEGVKLCKYSPVYDWKPSKLILVNAEIAGEVLSDGLLNEWQLGDALDQSFVGSLNQALEAPPNSEKPKVFCVSELN